MVDPLRWLDCSVFMTSTQDWPGIRFLDNPFRLTWRIRMGFINDGTRNDLPLVSISEWTLGPHSGMPIPPSSISDFIFRHWCWVFSTIDSGVRLILQFMTKQVEIVVISKYGKVDVPFELFWTCFPFDKHWHTPLQLNS